MLQFLNYGLENVKWRQSFKELRQKTFLKSWAAVYAGNAVAIFTPNRLGTFIGRAAYLDDISKTKTTYTTFVSNYSQLLSTMIMGVVGLTLMWNNGFDFKLPAGVNFSLVFLIFLPATIIALAAFYYQHLFIELFKKIKFKFIEDAVKKLEFTSKYSDKDITLMILIALARYMAFTMQIYWASQLFDINESFIFIWSFGSIMYLFSIFLPSPFLGNLGTREAIAVFLISGYGYEVHIIATTLLVWLFNVVFPSVFGGIIFLFKK